jgi:hypothetical protein
MRGKLGLQIFGDFILFPTPICHQNIISMKQGGLQKKKTT